MSREDLLLKAKRIPFFPFQVTLTTGESFDLRHPDLIMVGRRSVVIGVAKDANQQYYDVSHTIDLIHVVSTKELSASADATTNGVP